MARIFRSGMTYAIVETGNYLSYICIDGIEEHITNKLKSALDCQRKLKQYTGRNWKWIA